MLSWGGIVAAVLVVLVHQCAASGVLEITLKNLDNPDGIKTGGRCCDEASASSWVPYSPGDAADCFQDACDHYIELCISNDTRYSGAGICDMGREITSTVWEKNSIKFKEDYYDRNPIHFKFTDWPRTIKIKLDIYDDDGYWGYEFVDRIDYTFKERNVQPITKAKKHKLNLAGTTANVKLIVKVFCSQDFFGKDCTAFCEEQDNDEGHFKCDPITGQRSCRHGWVGDDCLTNPDDCAGHRCHGNAICVDKLGYYTCECPPGKAGPLCQGEINECLGQPCKNGGTCNDLLADFSCDCPRFWGGPTCEDEIKPCTTLNCDNGYCTRNETGSEYCVCDNGWRGRRCQVAKGECDADPCGENSIGCTNLAIGYRCHCKPGYVGRNCQIRISNCDSKPCQNGGQCCDDQTQGGFSCDCLPGYLGYLCESGTDECASSPCQNGGFCKDAHLGYDCLCRGSSSGLDCGDPDPCDRSPCLNSGTCVPGEGLNYTCMCAPGFSGDTCEEAGEDPCKSDPCENDGECRNVGGTFECTCKEGFIGTKCEEDVDECESQPCQNGGTCKDGRNCFVCLCPPGFTGDVCTELTIPTPPIPPIVPSVPTPFQSVQELAHFLFDRKRSHHIARVFLL